MASTSNIADTMLDVTVHTRSLAYDLQLPCTIPVQRITADVIAWINAYASDDSGLDPHRKYSLETTTGESLQESGTLAGLNIRHGTHLHLKEVDDAPRPIPVIEDIGTYLQDNHGSGRPRATFGGIRAASANIANVAVPIILAVAVVVPPVPPSAVTVTRLVILAAALIAIVGSFLGSTRGWITQQRLAGILLGGTAVTACGTVWLLHDPAPATTAEIILGTLFLAVAIIHIFSAAHRTILLAGEVFLLSSMVAVGISQADGYWPAPAACYVVVGLTLIVFVNASPIAVVLARIPTPKFPSKTNTYVIDVIRGQDETDLSTVREKTRYAVEYIAGIIIGLGAFHAAATYIVISHSGGNVLALCLASAFPIIYITATFNYTLAIHVYPLLYSAAAISSAIVIALIITAPPRLTLIYLGVALLILGFGTTIIPTNRRQQTPLVRQVRIVVENTVIIFALVAPVILLDIPQTIYNRGW